MWPRNAMVAPGVLALSAAAVGGQVAWQAKGAAVGRRSSVLSPHSR